MNIGFEFQTPTLSFCRIDPATRRLYFKEGHDVYKKTTPRNRDANIEIYGDASTDKTWYSAKRKDLLSLSKRYTACMFRGDHEYILPLDGEPGEFLNDLEFVNTIFTTTEVPIKARDIIDYMKRTCRISLESIISFVRKNTVSDDEIRSLTGIDRKPTETRERESKRRRTQAISRSAWPFGRILRLKDDICILHHDSTPVQWSRVPFYIQSTIGVPLRDAVELMIEIEQECPPAGVSIKTIVQKLSYIPVYSRASRLIKIVSTLFIYSLETRENRKASPFIIRHLFASIMKNLTDREYNTMLSILSEYAHESINMTDVARLYRTLQVIEMREDLSPKSKTRRIELKAIQRMDISTTFPLRFSALDTMILIEIRCTHSMLSPPRRQGLIHLDMLKK